MIIKKVVIENFLCYYDKKEFVFADGLNIILGENGEGKTKFYEALEWLFNNNVARFNEYDVRIFIININNILIYYIFYFRIL